MGMRYETVKDLTPAKFKRLTGVKSSVFSEMLGVIKEAEAQKIKAGRGNKLSLED